MKNHFPPLAEINRLIANIEATRSTGADSARFVATVRQKALRETAFDWQRVERAADAIKELPTEGEYLHAVCAQQFAGFDLVPAMLHLSGAKRIKELRLASLGFSRRNLEQLTQMIQGGAIEARTCRVLCGDFFRKADSDIWHYGADLARKAGFGFRSCRNHAKLILAAIGPARFVVESSANLRSCFNIETFTLCRSRALYRFHAAWIDRVWKTAAK